MSHRCIKDIQFLYFYLIQGGLDDYLRSILLLCDQYELPKIFAMTRHGLGKTLKKKAPVSIIGIFNYDGAQVCVDFDNHIKHKLI